MRLPPKDIGRGAPTRGRKKSNLFARPPVTGGAASFFCVRVWGKMKMSEIDELQRGSAILRRLDEVRFARAVRGARFVEDDDARPAT